MHWRRALAASLLIMIAALILGGLRQFVITPLYGFLLARQATVLIGSATAFAISWAYIRQINSRSFSDQLKVGVVWFVLTALCEYSLTLVLDDPIISFGGAFSFLSLVQGGTGFGLLFVLFAPALAAKARGFVSTPSMPMRQKLLIGVLLPVFLYCLAVFITPAWPCGSTSDPAGQVQLIVFFLLLAPVAALLDAWVLRIAWKNAIYCFLAGMCVPTIAFVSKVAVSCGFV